MKIGSLFSGYGGLDLAVTNVTGAEVAWHCEWEDAPSKILDAHFPGVPNYKDVTQVDFTQVEPVDILTGGFPCQDLSLAGKRKGLTKGTRSGLWSEFARAIETLNPRLVVIENVRCEMARCTSLRRRRTAQPLPSLHHCLPQALVKNQDGQFNQ